MTQDAAPIVQTPSTATGLGSVEVIVSAPVGLLSYAYAPEHDAVIASGAPVIVPMGQRTIEGYVLEKKPASAATSPKTPARPLKTIIRVDDERPTLQPGLLALVMFASRYFLTSPGEMLACALPAAARPSTLRYRITAIGLARAEMASGKAQELLRLAQAHPKGFGLITVTRTLGWRRPQATQHIRRAVRDQELEPLVQRASRGRRERIYRRVLNADTHVLSARHKRAQHLLGHLDVKDGKAVRELAQHDPNPSAPLKTLVRLGLVTSDERRVPLPETPSTPSSISATPKVLTAAQQSAVDALADGDKRPTLLFGVTGSGKTEIYLHAMARVLATGKTALMLVPEIALTPQLAQAFVARFGSKVATFHSGLSVAERRDEWERIYTGEAQIGLGARSAIFLPLKNLGLVVVDEEHESSFKQDESPRYNARDLAIWRAQHEGAQIVLGSATPSLESWHNAQTQRFRLISLPGRVLARKLPAVTMVPLKDHPRDEGQLIAQPLKEAICETVARGEQVILFLNRRGFAPYIFCRDCGHSFRCLDCDVALTLHQRRDILMCHYCGIFSPTPECCSACESLRVGSQGSGTERLEAEVRQRLGIEDVIRLDRDTVRQRHDLTRLLTTFRRGEAKVLIGTQMVAKGHDFPAVTLVGVVSADNSLNFPDFRASERTFSLLTQVAGRAGRGEKPGRVLVQAYDTLHPAITYAMQHDFLGFVTQELEHRKELLYPPYAYLALIRFEGEDEAKVLAAAKAAVARWQPHLNALSQDLMVLGPAPAPLARLRRHYRIHVLIKASQRALLRAALAKLGPHACRHSRRVIDIDPVNML